MRRESSTTGTGIRVSVRIHSLRCLLGDGLRGEGGWHPLTLSWVPPGARCASYFGLDVPVKYAAEVPAALRDTEGDSVSVPRQTALTSSCATEACMCSANSTVQFFDVVYVPTVVRGQVPEMVQTVQKNVKFPHASLDKVLLPVVMQDRGCPDGAENREDSARVLGHDCLARCDARQGVVQTVQKNVKFPHAFLDKVVLPVVMQDRGLSRQCRKP